MIKFSQLSKFFVFRKSFNSAYLLPFLFRRSVSAATSSFYVNNEIVQERDVPIIKINFERFNKPDCLVRWGEVSDQDFGGNSTAQLSYDQQQKCLNLKGQIDPTDRQKLQTIPFIGMIQKRPFDFKVGAFNSLRVNLKGDGYPLHAEVKFLSPLFGDRLCSAAILARKDQWLTYQLPLRNFQMKGFEVKNRKDTQDKFHQSVQKIMEEEMSDPDQFTIQTISFRLPESERRTRDISVKSIELVRTMRGTQRHSMAYKKPYFYIVDPQQTRDSAYKHLDLGQFTLDINQK